MIFSDSIYYTISVYFNSTVQSSLQFPQASNASIVHLQSALFKEDQTEETLESRDLKQGFLDLEQFSGQSTITDNNSKE